MNDNEVNTVFKVSMDVIDSRAISDGLTVDELYFEAYEKTTEGETASYTKLPSLSQKVDVSGKTATVTTKLVKGKTYKFAFWAQKEGAYVATDLQNIQMNYGEANDESRDAFFANLEKTVDGSFEEDVTLYRPFAQVNFGAADVDANLNINGFTSQLIVNNVPDLFNVLSGEASGNAETVTFTATAVPALVPEVLTVNNVEYTYISMNYILAAPEQATKDITLNVLDGGNEVKTLPVANCPMRRNHRTNILGDIVSYNGDFNIVIDPIYDQPDIPGAFSVSATKKVEFAPGNVQYHTGLEQWRFAGHQYDVIGEDDNIRLGAPDLSAWVDLFAWSCESKPYGVSPSNKDADYTGNFMDWGALFEGGWYTPTKDEFQYLLNGRTNAANLRAEGTVAGQNGLILLPDDWILPAGLTFVPGYVGLAGWNGVEDENADIDEYTENIYTAEQWRAMEAAGAVFLPHAGSRTGGYGNTWNGASSATSTNPATGFYSWVDNVQYYGYYWSSTLNPNNSNNAYYLITPRWSGNDIVSYYYAPTVWDRERRRGNSVRLVRAIN